MINRLFISDLHLCAERPEITRLFLHFLSDFAVKAQELYILGDLFEAWLGDDTEDELSNNIVSALRQLSNQGTAIAFMHGNRDFLLGSRFAKLTGCTLINDPTLIHIDNIPVLLSHGDQLCIDDVDYQAFRKQVRNPMFQEAFLSLPMQERINQARGYRELSKQSTEMKTEDIMDVNSEAVDQIMGQYQAQHLIHGHTHRPAIHQLSAPQSQRLVLGDWGTNGSVLIHNNKIGFQLHWFSQDTLPTLDQLLA